MVLVVLVEEVVTSPVRVCPCLETLRAKTITPRGWKGHDTSDEED